MTSTITTAIAEPSPYSLTLNDVDERVDRSSGSSRSSGRASRMIQIWLKTWKSQMIERLVRITKIGFRSGNVMSRKIRTAAGAVDRRRLDQLLRHLRQAGVDRDRDERDRAPDDDRGDHREARPRVRRTSRGGRSRRSASCVSVQFDDAELVVDHPAPDVHRDDDRHRPDEDEARS